jgi:hypothetical protein
MTLLKEILFIWFPFFEVRFVGFGFLVPPPGRPQKFVLCYADCMFRTGLITGGILGLAVMAYCIATAGWSEINISLLAIVIAILALIISCLAAD